MSNNINRVKKNRTTRKRKEIFAAAALTATLIVGNVPAITESVSAAESQECTVNSLIPDNITIDQPRELANIGLPATEYGTLEWADESFIPTQRVQACEVFLIPAEGQDLSYAEGWNSDTGAVIGYINVVVNSITDSNDADDSDKAEEAETPTETPAADEKDVAENTDADKNKSDKDNDVKDETDESDKESNKNSKDEKTDADKTEEDSEDTDVTGKLESVDDVTQNTDEAAKDEEEGKEDNIFDNPVLPDNKDERPTDAEDNLSEEEKEERAEINHTCDGITVSGINLPWYVQFRVSSGDSYQFTNESDAMIFQSYEFELWDLQNNTEYEIPSGDYISVTVPVKSGYQYTIEHILDNGATETIIPSVDNGIMVFSTHSFSPFGIAGSKQLVGPDTGVDEDLITPIPDSGSANGQTSDSTNSNIVSMNEDSGDEDNSSAQTDPSSGNKTVKNNNAVNTGDTTTIMPFVILVAAAAVIIGTVIFIKKKKK